MVELDYLYKISVFVPKNYSEKVRNVLFKYHAGEYGNYDEASFISYGTGTFRPLEGSNPYMGEKNKLENVEELKIEVVIDKKYLDIAIENMLSAHPYETVAYDIIKLENISNKYSLGITGYLEKGMEIEELAEVVKEKFKINMLKIVRSNNKKNGKIAICSGAGSEYIEKASKLGCKCLITGDVKYHEAQLARQLNINVIDAGHFETENIYIEYFAKFIKNRCIEKEYDVKIIQSENIINPFEYK